MLYSALMLSMEWVGLICATFCFRYGGLQEKKQSILSNQCHRVLCVFKFSMPIVHTSDTSFEVKISAYICKLKLQVQCDMFVPHLKSAINIRSALTIHLLKMYTKNPPWDPPFWMRIRKRKGRVLTSIVRGNGPEFWVAIMNTGSSYPHPSF